MPRTFSSRNAVRYLLSLAAGALIPLGFSPFDYWPISMLAVGAIFLLSRNLPVKVTALCGFLFGLGMFGAGTSWVYVSVHEFGAASPLLAGLLTSLFVAGVSAAMILPLFWIYGWLNQRKTNASNKLQSWQQALLFAGLWVLFEWVRSWLFTGFPWLLLGYTLIDTPFSGLAPVTGTYGLSLLITATICLLATLLIPNSQKKQNLLALLPFMACWAVAWSLSSIQWTEKTGTLSFSAVQGNIPQNLKWDPRYVQSTLNTYMDLSEGHWDQDLVIWPENAIPLFYNRAKGLMNQLDRHAKQNNSALILGMPVDDNSGDRTRYYNGILSMGAGEGMYFKQQLVPFGEYVPMEFALRGLIGFFNLPMSDFSKGSPEQELLKAGNAQIAPYICYEVVYPDFAAQLANDSDLLVTISNDTWFGQSIGPVQHFQIARMRALETRRYMIRATNDGITALINEKGKVLEIIPRFSRGVLSATTELRSGTTPFMIFGSWPVLLMSLLLMAVPSRLKKRPSPKKTD